MAYASKTEIRNPDALVSTDWLAERLDDQKLRIFDCSTVLEFEEGGKRPYRVVGCKSEHDAGHIPGAGFFDLQADFSKEDSPYGMTLGSPEQVAAAFENCGVDDSSHVILYSRRSPSWATRFWWMLRWLGFDRASVLDGGFEKWTSEKRPLSKESNHYKPGRITVNLRPHLFVDKDQVLAAINNPAICMVNALGRDIHSGENPRYGRPGHIPGSVNVPQIELVDADSNTFLPPDRIAAAFVSANATDAEHHITYCGGAIFATVDAFWLHQLGYDDVAVYENSMSEWGPDSTLPIESG